MLSSKKVYITLLKKVCYSIFMMFIIQEFLSKIRKKISKNTIVKIFMMAIFIVLLSSLLFYVFESKQRGDITFFYSLYWGFVTITTVGYGDIYPITLGGRIVATFLMLVGIGSFGLITAAVASIFIDKMFKGENGKMKINLKNHIVIMGWNKKTKSIIDEIKNESSSNEVLVISNKEGMKKPDLDIQYVNGEETDDTTLELANIKYASKVIILTDETINNTQMQDAKSVLICLAIDKLNEKIHIIAEVADEKNINHFKRANVDEFIISSSISAKIIARSAMHKHVSDAIKELVTNSFGNELYEKEIVDLKNSITFKQLLNDYLNQKCIIIGIVKGEKTIVNPPLDLLINNNDYIIYISQEAI